MCGILGIYSNKYIYNSELINLLKNLQHRGKDAYGISFLYKKKLFVNKFKGKVKNIKKKNELLVYSCISQTKYTTSLKILNEKTIQPLISKNKFFSLVHNGNIPNLEIFDTQYLVNYIENSKYIYFEDKLIDLINNVNVAYSIIILTKNNNLYALRDRYGIRPLCIGYKNKKYIISSESFIFKNNEYIRDIKPGELVKINNNGIESLYIHPKSKIGICSLELIYLMNEKSITDNYSVYELRKKLSHKLAKKDIKNSKLDSHLNNNIVIGIPNTGIHYGKCYAQFLNLQYKQYIKKNTHERTFIHNDKNKIKKKCNKKFNYSNYINGKNIIIVDDSIVRGNVIKSIIQNLKRIGAKQIHIRIPSPPVIDTCELGISIDNKKELIMNGKNINELNNELGCNTIKYLDLKDLTNIFPKNSYNKYFGGKNNYY